MIKKAIEKYFYKNNNDSNWLKDNFLEILGIYDGSYAYKGPHLVQIDLSNDCNNNCIACWCNSPLLKEKRMSGAEKKQHLPLSLVKQLIDDISKMGTGEIYYSGSGEPFMHPDIMEILEYSKSKNMTCYVNTNFTLLNREKLEHLIKLGVDSLTVSIWAGTVDTYEKTHSNRTKKDFYKIKDNLLYLNTHKNTKPYIKLYNVIFNMNYLEIEEMLNFATETKSESVEFTLVDTIPDATDALALDEKQLTELSEICSRIKAKLDINNRVKNNGLVIFEFDRFLRRISVSRDVKEAKYDRNIIDSMPCYAGWTFARVIPNGEMHSCLKSHRIPTGSLYKNRFHEVWNLPKQFYFREKTLICKKNDPFFKLIGNDPYIQEAGCYKSCDNIGGNLSMHRKMEALNTFEKLLFKSASKILKTARKLKPIS